MVVLGEDREHLAAEAAEDLVAQLQLGAGGVYALLQRLDLGLLRCVLLIELGHRDLDGPGVLVQHRQRQGEPGLPVVGILRRAGLAEARVELGPRPQPRLGQAQRLLALDHARMCRLAQWAAGDALLGQRFGIQQHCTRGLIQQGAAHLHRLGRDHPKQRLQLRLRLGTAQFDVIEVTLGVEDRQLKKVQLDPGRPAVLDAGAQQRSHAPPQRQRLGQNS